MRRSRSALEISSSALSCLCCEEMWFFSSDRRRRCAVKIAEASFAASSGLSLMQHAPPKWGWVKWSVSWDFSQVILQLQRELNVVFGLLCFLSCSRCFDASSIWCDNLWPSVLGSPPKRIRNENKRANLWFNGFVLTLNYDPCGSCIEIIFLSFVLTFVFFFVNTVPISHFVHLIQFVFLNKN